MAFTTRNWIFISYLLVGVVMESATASIADADHRQRRGDAGGAVLMVEAETVTEAAAVTTEKPLDKNESTTLTSATTSTTTSTKKSIKTSTTASTKKSSGSTTMTSGNGGTKTTKTK